MRIVHWYPGFLEGGAVSNAVAALAAAQAELGEDVAIAAAATSSAPLLGPVELDTSVRLCTWKPSWTVEAGGLVGRWLAAPAAWELASLRPDVVHVHAEFNPDNLWAGRIFAAPLVLSPHGAFHPVVLGKGRPSRKRAYVAVAERLLYRRSTIHALCPHEREHIGRLLPRAEIYCAPHGPGVRVTPPASLGPAENRPGPVRFLFCGRLDVYTKGLDVLLDAFARARRELREDSRLILVGPDWNGGRRLLEERARALGLSDAVELTGGIPGDAVARMLVECDVYVQLSRHDGFPLSVAEALLCGRPCVLSDAVGTVSYPEIAALPHVRVVAPEATRAAEALAAAARSRHELREGAAAVQPRIDDFFSWARAARLHLDAYRALARTLNG